METKEFSIEMAFCRIECHSRKVYLNGNHALRTQPRLFSYLVSRKLNYLKNALMFRSAVQLL